VAWSLIVPVKRLALAKSRLIGPRDGIHSPALALALVRDTIAAAVSTAGVTRVVVVTEDEEVRAAVTGLGAVVRSEVPQGGLNAAISAGASYAVGIAGRHPVAALPSDLPALTPDVLAEALAAAAGHPSAFVPDTDGTGTTLLTATSGDLHPRYGPDSASEHALDGAIRLVGNWPGLRRDVDTIDDLLTASSLGVGRATEALLAIGPNLRHRAAHTTPCA
jgi:2-phospho-L-lactate guanylyltransferase